MHFGRDKTSPQKKEESKIKTNQVLVRVSFSTILFLQTTVVINVHASVKNVNTIC